MRCHALIGAMLHEQLHDTGVAVFDGEPQGGIIPFIADIQLSALLQ